MITTEVVKQGIIVLNCFLTRLHFYSHCISGWMSYPAAVWLPHSTSLLSPSFLKWLFVNKPLGSLTWDGGQDGLCRIVKWITRHSDNREMPVYIFKIRKSPPAYPWALPLHPQRKRPVAVGKWKESLSRNSGSSVLVSHTQIGVPELRTYCSDPWALLNDLHPLRLWMMGLKSSIQARSLRSVTQEERAWRMTAWRRRCLRAFCVGHNSSGHRHCWSCAWVAYNEIHVRVHKHARWCKTHAKLRQITEVTKVHT